MEKNQNQHSLEDSHPVGGDFNDRLMSTAYGLHGLGLPLSGLKHNVKYLHSNVLQKFQLEHINPSRIFVCGAGVENHEEFVDLAEKTFGFIPTVSGSVKQREATKYVGGESRTSTEDNEIKIALAFHSVPWKHEDMVVFNIINTLLGQSSSFSTGGPGKGMHSRTTKNLLNNPKYPYIESANSINMHFSDSGLFGLSVSGNANKGQDILKALVTELKNLTQNIPAEELTRAKNILKSHILMAMERQQDRLEESIKNIKTFGELRCHDYATAIDKVTADQLNKAIGRIIAGAPTLVVEGAEAGRLPSYDKVVSSLKV
jgi:predicted Zn-dependent peptidase